MGKSRRGNKEFTKEQRLIKENRQLKRELAYLRKQISRLDFEGLEAAKQICFDQEEKERINSELGDPNSNLEDLKKKWACNKCAEGFLEITLYSKLGQTYYYRRCCSCDNRTKGKRYDSETVKGLVKNG